MKHSYANGKYTVIFDEASGKMSASRNAEPWQDLTGNGLILAMLQKTEDYEKGLMSDLLQFAISGWQREVANRPLINVHRRSLDDTWRQVIRHCGGDPDILVGPSHDQLLEIL